MRKTLRECKQTPPVSSQCLQRTTVSEGSIHPLRFKMSYQAFYLRIVGRKEPSYTLVGMKLVQGLSKEA
jgi:hypothetical protein